MPPPEDIVRPSWEPNRTPVNFNDAAAVEAAKQCRAVAQGVRDLREIRGTRGELVLQHWQGRYRNEWEVNFQPCRTHELNLADVLDALALRIEGWAKAAGDEQTRRTNEIARWDQEYRQLNPSRTPPPR